MEKSAPQAQTPIGPYSTLSDCLFPVDNIYMNDVYQGWMQKPLQSNEGRYSIAILQNGKESNLQGNFTMTEEETKVPMHICLPQMRQLQHYYMSKVLPLLLLLI